jgi:hypothetical protein
MTVNKIRLIVGVTMLLAPSAAVLRHRESLRQLRLPDRGTEEYQPSLAV